MICLCSTYSDKAWGRSGAEELKLNTLNSYSKIVWFTDSSYAQGRRVFILHLRGLYFLFSPCLELLMYLIARDFIPLEHCKHLICYLAQYQPCKRRAGSSSEPGTFIYQPLMEQKHSQFDVSI